MMESKELHFPHKRIRAKVIAEFARSAAYHGVVCFTCGNAAQTLRDQGLEVTEVGPRGDLNPSKWWTIAEIHRTFPHLFDATSGHLPIPLLADIAKAFREHLGDLPSGRYSVPSGSGETITCLRVAYPLLTFDASYDNSKPETVRHPDAPLNAIVDADSVPASEEEKETIARLMDKYGRQVTSIPPRTGFKQQRAFWVGVALLVLVAALSSLGTFMFLA